MVGAGMEALALGGDGFFPHRPQGVLPVSDLEGMARKAIEVAGVVAAAGTEPATDRQTQQERKQAGDLPLGPITLPFGC